jgi:dihydrofolate reductase
MPVLMGRKTFESFGEGKPLPGRVNIILTRKKDYKPEGIVVVQKLDDAYFFVNENDFNELMVIGGGELYNMMMPKANKIYLTRVHQSFTDADAFFPSIDEKKWHRTSQQNFAADEKHQYAYSFEIWERK